MLNCRSAGSHGVPKGQHMIRCLQTLRFNSRVDGGEIKLRTSSTSADASERTGAAASVLLIRVRVAQFLCHGAISQPDLDVGQISPVRAWSQWDVTHSTFHQSAHVLRAQSLTFSPAMQVIELMTEGPTSPHLADVISENGLVLCASDLPLEPGLRLAVVGDLQCRCTVADLGQIGHGVSDGDGSVNSAVSSVGRQNKQTNKQSF